MEVAFKVDILAEIAMEVMQFKGKRPNLPGQLRWQVTHTEDGVESIIVGNLRAVMQRKCKQDYIMQYLRLTRNGTLKSAIDLTAWQALSQFNPRTVVRN